MYVQFAQIVFLFVMFLSFFKCIRIQINKLFLLPHHLFLRRLVNLRLN